MFCAQYAFKHLVVRSYMTRRDLVQVERVGVCRIGPGSVAYFYMNCTLLNAFVDGLLLCEHARCE